jgi:hypothetical protein
MTVRRRRVTHWAVWEFVITVLARNCASGIFLVFLESGA